MCVEFRINERLTQFTFWRPMRAILAVFLAICVISVHAVAQPKAEDLVKVDLISSVKAFEAGKPFDIAVRYRIEKEWHLYWLNPGDSGIPPKLKWTLPAGFSASEPRFPVPRKIGLAGDILNYGYSDELVLFVTITPPSDASGTASLKLLTNYLVCKDICLPGKASADLAVSVGSPEKNDSKSFALWQAKMPVETKGRAMVGVQQNEGKIDSINVRLVVELPQNSKDPEFFPGPSDGYTVKEVKVDDSGEVSLNIVPLNKVSKLDETVWGILAYTDSTGIRRGLELKTHVDVDASK
jgi:DsbC/DsbD-like thiol-disulfide interchange protein